MQEDIYPKVLLCAPQHSSKMYCWMPWIERVYSLSYPNFEIFIADNSDTMDNVSYMNTFDRVTAVYTPDRKKGLLQRINDSHKQCVEYAKKNKFTWIFHLETDVFPPIDVIERLMCRKRPIIAGCYDIEFGKNRKSVIQIKEGLPRTVHGTNVFEDIIDEEALFFDGTVKEVFRAGLGCILIHLDVFKALSFRVIKGINIHTDSIFAGDCFTLHKDIVVDTSIMCNHYNQEWLSKEQEY